MKNTSKIISYLFLVGGIGIIIAIFFLFLQEYQEEKLFYLNLVMTCVVFAIIFFRAFDILGSVEKFAKNSSGYGLLWFGIWLYTPIALGLIAISIGYDLSFKFSLIGHLALLFILAVIFYLVTVVNDNTNEVMGNIESRKSGLKEISSQIALLEMHSKLGKGPSYQKEIDKLKESVRFITASDDSVAVAYEKKLIEKIKLISSQLEHNSQPADVINAEFDECMSIIELRRKQY